jgi:hypothetical protein
MDVLEWFLRLFIVLGVLLSILFFLFLSHARVVKAHSQLAVHTLMISDTLFRSQDIRTRAKHVEIVQQVRENGGTVYIFSSLHVSGSRMSALDCLLSLLSDFYFSRCFY